MPKKPRSVKSIGRKRRAAGWMLLSLGLIVTGVWVASACLWGVIGGKSVSVRCGLGQVEIRWAWPVQIESRLMPISPEEFHFEWLAQAVPRFAGLGPQPGWGIGVVDYRKILGGKILCAVLWPIPLLHWAPAALLLRSGILARRRANSNGCPKCGYSLAGLAADTPCPECGKGGGTT